MKHAEFGKGLDEIITGKRIVAQMASPNKLSLGELSLSFSLSRELRDLIRDREIWICKH